jgi:OmpA-OmpF porin, OOP family
MSKRLFLPFIALLSTIFLGACAGSSYEPAAAQSEPVDLSEFVPRVDTFIVLLDTSGSMRDDDNTDAKFRTAQNMVANFNAAVPESGFNAGLVIFGKGAGSCMGNGVAKKIYGMTEYKTDDFLSSLGSIDCVRSTTPVVEAINLGTDMLADEEGEIAVVVFSDLKWKDADGVRGAIAEMTGAHPDRLCLHTVRVGDYSSNDDLIADINPEDACGSTVDAADITDPNAMTAYVADILMSPVEYTRHTISAMALFDFDKSIVKEEGKAALDELGESIKSKGIRVKDVDIIGHTDSVGTQVYNAGLSERRANAVAEYLISIGVNADIVSTAGMGELDPVDTNNTDAGRAKNRRVEVLVGAARPAGS